MRYLWRDKALAATLVLSGALCAMAAWAPRPAYGYDFEWIGKIELDAEGLTASDPMQRRQAVAALKKYDIGYTKPYLLKALRDGDRDVRIQAGLILGQSKVLEAAPVVIEWLNEADAVVKKSAAEILGELGTEEAAAALIRSLGDADDQVRERAVEALGKIGTPSVVIPLIGRLEDDKSAVRRAAIAQLRVLGDRRAVIPVVGLFSDTNLDVRTEAILAVGYFGDPAPIPALLRLLRDSVDAIRAAAVSSLGNLHADVAADVLMEELGRGSDEYRGTVAYALGQIAKHTSDAAAATAIVRALTKELKSEATRAAVSEALRSAGQVAVPALIAHLDGELDGDLVTVLELVRDIGDARATPALIRELDRGRVSQDLLLEALRAAGDERALMPLLGLLSSEDDELRLKAMDALRPLISDSRAADLLIGLLGDRNLEIQILAAEYLGLLRAQAAVDKLLVAAAPGSDRRLRLAAVDALGEIADGRAASAMIDILASGPAFLQHSAANALIYMGSDAAVSKLLAMARNPEAAGRRHAVRALGGIVRGKAHEGARRLMIDLAEDAELATSLAAIEVLGAMEDKESVPALKKLLGADNHRRRAAVTALGNLGVGGDAALVAAVLDALGAQDDRVSGDAAWALGKLRPAEALEALVHACKRRGFVTPINASAALARYAPASYAAKLTALLTHPSRFVRANAAAGLGRLKAEAARPALVRIAQKDASWLARLAAVRALSRIGGAAETLREVRERDVEPLVRQLAAALESAPFAPVERSDWRTFFFVDPDRDDAPVREEPYFLVTADGLVTALYTDARGLATEEAFPPGDYILEPRSKESRY